MDAPRRSAGLAAHLAGLGLLLLPWVLLGGGGGCLSTAKPPPPTPYCPSSWTITNATSSVHAYPFEAVGALVNGRGVEWNDALYGSTGVALEGPDQGCFQGGGITGPWDPSSTWDTYHLTAGVSVRSPAQPIRTMSIHVRNYGDGVSIEDYVACLNGSLKPWLYVRSSHLEDIHDDAIESDGLCAVEIADNLIERAFVAFAFRNRLAEPDRWGNGNTVTVDGNLVRMHSFLHNFNEQPGHNGIWKWAHEEHGPRIVVKNNVFLAFDAPPHGTTLLPYLNKVIGCENNELLFAGSEAEWAQALAGGCDTGGDDGLCEGERLVALSYCYTVVTKGDAESEADFLATHWDPLVASWKATHMADDE